MAWRFALGSWMKFFLAVVVFGISVILHSSQPAPSPRVDTSQLSPKQVKKLMIRIHKEAALQKCQEKGYAATLQRYLSNFLESGSYAIKTSSQIVYACSGQVCKTAATNAVTNLIGVDFHKAIGLLTPENMTREKLPLNIADILVEKAVGMALIQIVKTGVSVSMDIMKEISAEKIESTLMEANPALTGDYSLLIPIFQYFAGAVAETIWSHRDAILGYLQEKGCGIETLQGFVAYMEQPSALGEQKTIAKEKLAEAIKAILSFSVEVEC